MHRLDDPISVTELDLDPFNPRLPEELQGGSQSAILKYLSENDVLEELVDSYLSNGYFESEPLITLPPDGGRRIVVEGNRRLAALMIVHQLPPAVEAEIPFEREDDLSAGRLAELGLDRLPVVEADDLEDVAAFLGFRHISGLKRWNAEAKARWLFKQVEARAATASNRGVFYDVGRQVGSNARGVRSSYIAYGLLRHARDILQLDTQIVSYVSRERFGVWLRLLGTANVPTYIGLLNKPSLRYEEVRAQVEGVDADRLAEVLGDLAPGPDGRPILGDSRDVTEYSDVLLSEPARSAMREFGSLDVAIEIARQGDLDSRLRQMTRTVELLTLDIKRYDVGVEEVKAADEYAAAARGLAATVRAALPEGDL
ncbi:hypothetical protein [Microbacterium phyllosphaerae]|uniref:hypothetical protein n=1 Tax=Microbacterium phyllosphaerae TaxID=124798 RepID=UPI00216901CB|nr:hypothetical protein [Microbacterium phyllosphaerae]MCS3442453.1 hypothetical protein [Microbacterium phyllosphaerae]